jgi:hypothetical protein
MTQESPQTLPAPGEVELNTVLTEALYFAVCTLAFHGRDRGTDRQEGMLDDLEKLARDLDPRIRAARASLSTVAAANDEGVAEAFEAAAQVCDERAAGRIRMYEDNQAGINAFKAVEAEECAAAIRLLSQGGGKARHEGWTEKGHDWLDAGATLATSGSQHEGAE